MSTKASELADELELLIHKADDENLADGGRYFEDSYVNFTACAHGDCGEHRNPYNGSLLELLWNNRHAILTAFRATPAADREAVLEEALVGTEPETGGRIGWLHALLIDLRAKIEANSAFRDLFLEDDPDAAWEALRESEQLVELVLAALKSSPTATSVSSEAWQPIETAPRDGTRFLAWCSENGEIDVVNWKLGHWMLAGTSFPMDGLAYWMPLPAPPTTADDGGEEG